MKSKWWLVIVLGLVMVVVIYFVRSGSSTTLVSPDASNINTQETAQAVPNAAPNAPKTYKFDSTTNLQEELDSVNPQVLDSDFE